ncbi:MAG: YidC/Oxa1 family membrane protein insertase [Patescibacteria group bacterium]
MLGEIWFTYLYQPVFNVLVWIYMNIADKNLGWAVVWLTIFLRVVLLPLTIISERDATRHKKAEEEAIKTAKAYKTDQVLQKEEIRKLMRKHRISPWAKVLTLGIQLLVLILLYQVFVRGITGDKLIKLLYSWVDFPGKMNINFYGFDIGQRNDWFWAGIAAIYLFMSIYISSHKEKYWEASHATFLILFPIFTFFALWALPMVKSLFILTSMIFSDIISVIRLIIFPAKEEKPV